MPPYSPEISLTTDGINIQKTQDKPEYVPVELSYIEVAPGRKVAYRKHVGSKGPTILYIPGFLSPMDVKKITNVEKFAREHGYSNVRYDQESCGFSGGTRETIEFEHWIEDALCMIDHVCNPKDPIILVSSSVGSWVSTIVAQKRPERIHSIRMIGPAFNIIWKAFYYYYKQMSGEEQKRIDEGEYLVVNLKYGGKNYLRKDLSERSRDFEIDTASPIDIKCPVRIIHAVHDRDVSFETALQIASNVATTDVDVILRKEGDHRLNSDSDTTQQLYEIHRLITQYPIA
uniref:Abhydrolase domain-containing protein 10, mitochondrial n=1 Tax=Caligus clemensi TaxID=344056 RepID=C1C2M0_CALCM|nr:Abhydrolase domain-containing protein 10, mitochondrial precursor [Caligus clemensi]